MLFKKGNLGWRELSILIVIAYAFSFTIRMIWVFQFQDNPNFIWNNQLMINTNDGYFFASAVEYLLTSAHVDNPRVHIAIDSYPFFVYTSYFLTKFTPMSLETTILYMPSIISSLVVIPIILTGKLLKLPWVGFFSALLGSIAWSYYNRTMIGYYDTDMFSAFLQFTVLYLFLLTIYDKNNKNILYLSIALLVYPLYYPQGLSLIYAIFILWVIYQFLFQRENKNSYNFIIIASVALWAIPLWLKSVIILGLFLYLEKIKSKFIYKHLIYLTLLSLFMFFIFGDVFSLIIGKIVDYTTRGVEEQGLHFYQVIGTVREAGAISWKTVANRIIGGEIPLVISVIGYILLVIKHRAFLIALPLIGVGIFSHWAGLRFTVYAVPVAAISAVYFFAFMGEKLFKNSLLKYIFIFTGTILLLIPNITHIVDYKVPTVLNKAEVQDLVKLNKIAHSKDYTLSWWDYAYPIWYYSDTSTLIDGSKHHNDNFIISQIMQTTSPVFAANLGRLAVETYVDSNYSIVANTLFKNGKKDQHNPNKILEKLYSDACVLPKKTRDIYLYLPYRMLRIFPTVSVFGNLDLMTGEKRRELLFYPARAIQQQRNIVTLQNGIQFDVQNGYVLSGNQKEKVKRFIVTSFDRHDKIDVKDQFYHADGNVVVLYMKNYGEFVVMDVETFHSVYVQMFLLGKYDKNLFELVVSSPYSKIYKLKK